MWFVKTELKKSEQRLQNTINSIREIEVTNANEIAAQKLEKLRSQGTPVIREQDPLFGYGFDYMWDLGSNVNVSAFPREMYPERPTTLRTQIAQDSIRFQSRIWYETCPQYSGVINHLRNFCTGTGMNIEIVSEEDEQLALDVNDYIDKFCKYKQNKINKRLYDSVLNYFRDGEDAIRLYPDKDGVNIRSVDTSTIRGAHAEITGPWSYGILTSYPHDYEDVKAYHLWYADNSHEDVSPKLLKFMKAETTGANVKRGVPLSYRMANQIRQLIRLSDATAIGEAARQSIPYLIQYQLQQSGQVSGQINSRIPSPTALNNDQANFNKSGDPKTDIIAGEIRHIGPGKEFIDSPSGHDSTWAYQMLCQQMATAINCPAWMVSGTANDTNFSSSLVAESPLVKLIQHCQQQVTDYYKEILEAVVEIGIAKGLFPVNTMEIIEIHCELPNPVARNMKDEIAVDIQLLKENILSPQHLCSRNGLDFEEEQELIEKAEADGWEMKEEIDPNSEEANQNKNNGDPNNEKKKLEE